MELLDLKTSQVINHILKHCENVKGLNNYTKEDQKTIILNALVRNVVLEEINNMVYFIVNDQFKED